MEYSLVTEGFTKDVCLVCSNDTGESATAKLKGIVQTSECTETNCHCKNSFENKLEKDIHKDEILAYSDIVKNYGNAFDLFFTNTGANTGCSVDSCSLYQGDCTTSTSNGHPVWIEGDNLKVNLNQERGFVSDLCIICKGEQEISQTFKITQTDQCQNTLTDKGATYSQSSPLKWFDIST